MDDTAGTGIGFAIFAGPALVVAILVGWVVFVARQKRWSSGNKLVVGAIGVVIIGTLYWYFAYTFLTIQPSEGGTRPSPVPLVEWIGTPDST